MRVPDSAPLRGWRCRTCWDLLEIATDHPASLRVRCTRCKVDMERAAQDSEIHAPIGSRYRSGDCVGCGYRIRLVPFTDWQDYCPTCRAGHAAHRAHGAGHDWLPPDPARDAITARLLGYLPKGDSLCS